MFVSAEDFNTPPYDLPNLAVNETFEDFVEQEEEEILVKLFGRSLYEGFIAGLAVSPVENIEVRWTRLRDGYTYTYMNRTYKWYGLKKMLVPYIYSKWLEYGEEHTTGVGVVVANTENSTRVSSAHKICRAWNKFADIAGHFQREEDTMYGYLYNSGITYSDVYPSNEYSDFRLYMNSYYVFPGYKNALGI